MRRRVRHALVAALAAACGTGTAGAGVGAWSSGGPEGGPVEALVFDVAGGALYAATRHNAVFRSTDSAASWTATGDGLPPTVLEIAATGDGTLLARGDSGGVLRSTDGGASWQAALGGLITALAAAPSAAGTAYAGTAGGSVFATTDGGQTWAPSSQGLPQEPVVRLAVDPQTPTTVYLGSGGGGAYKSSDGGAGWVEASQGLGLAVIRALVIDPVTPSTLYAAADDGLFQSTDGGGAWSELAGPATAVLRCLAIDPAAPATLLGGAPGTVFRSDDGGASWTEIGGGVPPGEVLALAVDPASSSTYYAGTAAGVIRSLDGGAGWAAANDGLRSVRIDRLAVDPAQPEILYAASSESGVFRSTDGGGVWTAAGDGLGSLAVADLELAPTLPQTLYASVSGLRRSQDSAASWSDPVSDPEEFGLLGPEVPDLAVDPWDAGTLFAFNRSAGGRGLPGGPGILRSNDAAVSWLRVFEPADLVSIRPGQVAVDPGDPQRVVAGLSARQEEDLAPVYLILRSLDGGSTWSEELRRTGEGFVALDFDPLTPGTVYALVAPGAGFAALRSLDGGGGWSDLALPLPCVNDLLPDPEVAGTLWAACDPVHRSEDGGDTWAAFDSTGFPPGVDALVLARGGGSAATLHAGTPIGVYSYGLPAIVDLAVSKEDGVTEVEPGDPLTYVVEVANLGPADTLGATVTDVLPAALACTWSCAGAGGGVCDPAPPAGDLAGAVDLPAGAAVTFTATCTVDPGAGGLLVNTAAAAPPAGALDPVPGNDAATDTDVVLEMGACGAADRRQLSNVVLAGSETIEACTSIGAGPAVVVTSEVTFRAPQIVWSELAVTAGSLTVLNEVP